MRSLLILTLIAFLLSEPQLLIGQVFADTVTIEDGKIALKVNAIPVDFELVKSTSGVVILSVNELKLIANKKIIIHNEIQRDTTRLANGKKQVTLSFLIYELTFNCLILREVDAKIVYTTPKYAPKQQAKFGVDVLERFSQPVKTTNQLIINNINPAKNTSPYQINRAANCAGSNAIPAPASTANDGLALLGEIKLIPCSSDPSIIQKKTQIRDYFEQQLALTSITEEMSLPIRVEAVNNVQYGLTIRYFDDEDLTQAQDMKTKLTQLLPNVDTYTEDKIGCCGNVSKGYLEVWIK